MIKNIDHRNVIHYGENSLLLLSNESGSEPGCLKILNDEYPTPAQVTQFEKEFEFCFNPVSDYIRRAFRRTQIDNHYALSLEYIDGKDLRKVISNRQLTLKDHLQIAINIARSLSGIHRHNIVHGQITPSNLIMEKITGKVFLIDFGAASHISSYLNTYSQKIFNIDILIYISPEQTGRINKHIDCRSDIYSYGVILYHLCTGCMPFDSIDPAELIYGHIAQTPTPPITLNKEIPVIVSEIIVKLLSKNAEDRYQSANGVQYDLENCLQQLNSTGRIETFELATNDFSGKFFIQQKLYGRTTEVATLFNIFHKCAEGDKSMLVVTGYAGSGKSTLISEVQKPVINKNGYFIRGKFDQIKSDTPYSAFIEAFTELIQYILTEDAPVQLKWKEKISEAVGFSGKILTDMVPGLDKLIGIQPEIGPLHGAEATNRFNYILLNFFKAAASKEQPLVIFIDDLQWSDASSLNLLRVILNDKDIKYLMVIASYRNNEVIKSHPLLGMLKEFRDTSSSYNEILLSDLDENNVNILINDLLRTKQKDAHELAAIVYSKTKGNPFYVHQFLKSISDEQFLKFDFDKMQWIWRNDLIMQMNVSGNVVDLMASLIQKMNQATIDLLKIASCVGNRFDKNILSVIKDIPVDEVERLLNDPLVDGLILLADTQYKFAHDRIQQSIYLLIPDGEKKELHLNIGNCLVRSLSPAEVSDRIFEIVNQFNISIGLIQQDKTRIELINLDLSAARKAISSAAYPQALVYYDKCIQLTGNEWWDKYYDLTLIVYSEAAEAAYYCGEYGKVDELVELIIDKSKTLIDSIKAYEVRIKKLVALNQMLEAISVGIYVLRKMHIHLSMKPGKLKTFVSLIKTKWALKNKDGNFLTAMNPMEDKEKNAIMRLLSDISSASYFAAPELVPLVIFKMIRLTVQYGLSRKSPYSFAAYGFILSAYMGEIDHGISFGNIAVDLATKLKANELYGSILTTNNLFLNHWRKPLKDTIPDLDAAFKSSIQSGDTEWTTYSAHNSIYQLFVMGYPLADLSRKMEALNNEVEKFRHELTLKRMAIYRQTVHNLLVESDDPTLLSGNIFSESSMSESDISENNKIYFENLFFQKLLLSIIFNKNTQALEYARKSCTYLESVRGSALYLMFYFYESLAITGLYFSGNKLSGRDKKILSKNISRLKKFEKFCPENYSYKRMLIEAEYNKLKGDNVVAKTLYDNALKGASENNVLHDLAICWERAAQFFIETKQDLLARFYLQNAYRTYQRWGAITKLTQMLKQYPDLETSSKFDLQSDLKIDPEKSIAGDVDLSTIVKASVVLSGEIVLSRLLKKLMQIIQENAGAQSAFLILEKGEARYIEAEISAENIDVTTMQSIPVINCGLLAESIINYVFLTKEVVMLDDAMADNLFANDEFIKTHNSRSILCVPLVNQGKLQAIIYLSNDLISGAFTQKRIAVLKMLSGQMAISIENALFYSDLEDKVNQRTYELQMEKKKSDDLLLNILPEDIANELKQTGRTKPRSYEMITVMFTDFKNFTTESEKLSPQDLVTIVDTCFRKFDEIISKYQIEKIKTIGDAYLCVSGLPNPGDHNPCDIIKAAIDIRNYIRTAQMDEVNGYKFFDIRIGIHSGPLVAGVVGNKKFVYDIWGDTVNTAARMEQNSDSNKINISQVTYELVKDKFNCFSRGKQPAKNKGMVDMYFVDELS